MAKECAHPAVMASTDWASEHRADTGRLGIVESGQDVRLYETGHRPEAVRIDRIHDVNDPVARDDIHAGGFRGARH